MTKSISEKGILDAGIRAVQWENFAVESDKIEGEVWNDVHGVEGVSFALNGLGFHVPKDFLKAHEIVSQRVKESWVGKWRTVDVRVGSWKAPKWQDVPKLMDTLCAELPTMDSWEAHNEFEHIHPFQDFNGRIGRLLWLSRAVKEGYRFQRPFLHEFYYQTLKHV